MGDSHLEPISKTHPYFSEMRGEMLAHLVARQTEISGKRGGSNDAYLAQRLDTITSRISELKRE